MVATSLSDLEELILENWITNPNLEDSKFAKLVALDEEQVRKIKTSLVYKGFSQVEGVVDYSKLGLVEHFSYEEPSSNLQNQTWLDEE